MSDNETREKISTRENPRKKVYFDNMLYVSKYIRREKKFTNIFDSVRDGNFQLMISTINLLEIHHVMSKYHTFDRLERQHITELSQDLNSRYNKIVSELNAIGRIKTDALENMNMNELINLTEEVHERCREYYYQRCKITGSADILHIMAAKKLGCTVFVTEDNTILLLGGRRNKRGQSITVETFHGMNIIKPDELCD